MNRTIQDYTADLAQIQTFMTESDPVDPETAPLELWHLCGDMTGTEAVSRAKRLHEAGRKFSMHFSVQDLTDAFKHLYELAKAGLPVCMTVQFDQEYGIEDGLSVFQREEQ